MIGTLAGGLLNELRHVPAYAYNIVKLFDPAVRLSRSNAVRRMNGLPGDADPMTTGASPIDLEQFMERLGGDQDLFLEVIRLFLEDCPMRVAAIKAAVDDQDAERIRTTAHALKGAAANLSAAGLCDAARVMERMGTEGTLDGIQPAWRQLSAAAAQVIDLLVQLERKAAGEAVP
jgi:HPt (histidine-containing phosphotransfer) domain-containing protein